MRSLIAAVCIVAAALLPACSRNKPPNSLFDRAGYHVRGGKVYFNCDGTSIRFAD